jgi:hypothetical protein
MKPFIFIIFMGFGFFSPLFYANAITFSANDFLPPAQAESPQQEQELSKVSEPDAVKEVTSPITGEKAISASSAQDAINAYLRQRSSGFTELQFPSGFGFAATGVGTYTKHPSVVASRIDQRNAFNKAYIQAKKNLAEGLYGISNEGKTKLDESMTNIDTGNAATLTNVSEKTSERIEQRVDGLLRGYVVYDVYDDFENSTVYVTIVTTPKTQGHYARPSGDSILAGSVQEGVQQVLVDLQKGLTPPVGGKTIFIPQTGELAFVGFGSAVVRVDSDKALQTKHNLNAQKIAQMRAVDALCGIILGDTLSSSSQLDSQLSSMSTDFEQMSKDDPVAKEQIGSTGYAALAQRQKEFVSVENNSSTISSMRKGILPPGLKQQGWFDDDKAFAYHVAVYIPSVSKRAEDARKSMQAGQIVQQPNAPEEKKINPSELPDAGTLQQGPSGRVQDDEAL